MFSKDMKYTALYWALRFFEIAEDIYVKSYNGYKVIIDAEAQKINYGNKIKVLSENLHFLKRHKDFVVLECVDRLLSAGTAPADIILDGRCGCPDVIVKNLRIYCEQWEKYKEEYLRNNNGKDINYTSRLVSGVIEYRTSDMRFEKAKINGNFEINNNELIFYHGKDKVVKIPEGIKVIASGAFWNNVFIEEVILPESLERLGGDCFYCCNNLKKVNIPSKLKTMGNNPFAGCPKLEVDNFSSKFKLINGALFDADGSNLIYYPISNSAERFEIPRGVVCIGKHSFFMCENIKKIVIPSSVLHMENNPFSGCSRLTIENHSPSYCFENGIIYNKWRSSIVGCLNGTIIDKFIVPDSVTAINRNAFWNCVGIKNIVIGKNVKRIGYNPFAWCTTLLLDSLSLDFPCENGIVYNKEQSHILCATNRSVGKKIMIKDGVTHINRGAFSGCSDLKEIDLNGVKYIDKSAISNCGSMEKVFIPDKVEYIGEWAFAQCASLKHVSVSRKTIIDRNAFNECNDVKIGWRE